MGPSGLCYLHTFVGFSDIKCTIVMLKRPLGYAQFVLREKIFWSFLF